MPRTKTYSAQSGWAYQFYFESHSSEDAGDRYRFQATVDRGDWFRIEVLVPRAALLDWEREHELELNPTERYAVAKMALFSALDAAATPDALPKPITVTAGGAREILRVLDI